MKWTLAPGIMTVPSRAEKCAELFRMLHHQVEGLDAGVPFTRLEGCELPRVHTDPQLRGTWYGWSQTARLCAESKPTHVLVLQDDAVPCSDMLATVLQRLIPARPDDVLSLYNGRPSYLRTAQAAGTNWVRSREYITAVASVWPTWLLWQALDWVEKNEKPDWGHHDDYRLGDFLKSRKRPVYYTMPTLVDHKDDGRSTVGNPTANRTGARQSKWLAASGLAVDWGREFAQV